MGESSTELSDLFYSDQIDIDSKLFRGLYEYSTLLCEIWQPNMATLMTQIIFQLEMNWLRPIYDLRSAAFFKLDAASGKRLVLSSSAKTCYQQFGLLQNFVMNQRTLRSLLQQNWRVMLMKFRVFYDEFLHRRYMIVQDPRFNPQDIRMEDRDPSSPKSIHTETFNPFTQGQVNMARAAELNKHKAKNSPFMHNANSEYGWNMITRLERRLHLQQPQSGPWTQGDNLVKNTFTPLVNKKTSDSSRTGDNRITAVDVDIAADKYQSFPDKKAGRNFWTVNRIEIPSNLNDLYAELVGVSYLLYTICGYQSSIGLGGQHRQRGAFFDQAWINLSGHAGHQNYLHQNRKNVSDVKCPIVYISVGERCDNIAVMMFKEDQLLNYDPLNPKGSKYEQYLISPNNYIRKDELEIRPVLFSPVKDDLLAGAKRNNGVMEFNALRDSDVISDAIVDQLYYSQNYETMAPDNDNIALNLIPVVPRAWQRYGCCIWATCRMAFLLENLKRTVLKQQDGESDVRAVMSVTYMDSKSIVPGGDWEEIGRDSMPTRAVLRDVNTNELLHVVHDFTPAPADTMTYSFPFSMPRAVWERNTALLEFEVEDRSQLSFVQVNVPIAEIWLKIESAEQRSKL